MCCNNYWRSIFILLNVITSTNTRRVVLLYQTVISYMSYNKRIIFVSNGMTKRASGTIDINRKINNKTAVYINVALLLIEELLPVGKEE